MKGRGRIKHPLTVAPDERASEVRVYSATTGELIRTEKPYREYARNDRRHQRGIAAHLDGNWNTARNHEPRSRRTGLDNGQEPAADELNPS